MYFVWLDAATGRYADSIPLAPGLWHISNMPEASQSIHGYLSLTFSSLTTGSTFMSSGIRIALKSSMYSHNGEERMFTASRAQKSPNAAAFSRLPSADTEMMRASERK